MYRLDDYDRGLNARALQEAECMNQGSTFTLNNYICENLSGILRP